MEQLNNHARMVVPVAIIAIALALFNLFSFFTHDPSKDWDKLYIEVKALGVLKVCEQLPKDTPVVLIAFDNEVHTPKYKRLSSKIKKGGVNVVEFRGIRADEDMEWDEDRIGLPYKEFLQVVQDLPHVEAVVSLVGAPFDVDETAVPDPSSLPSLLVISDDWLPERLLSMLDSGRLALPLVPRENSSVEKLTDPAELFEREYEMLYAPAP